LRCKSATYASIGECVHQAITNILNIPSVKHYQIVTEQRADFSSTADSRKAESGSRAAIVLIYLMARYSGRRKRALFGRVADLLRSETQIQPREVVIGLIETPRENWSFGYDEALFLEMMAYQLP
jgi:4-oxalocrotonate tautomerase